jgi:xanthine/CO dehydrogenase XdhC/CoxF family maturation factor
METLFCTMRDTLKSGGDLVLCTIIASSGSTPRGSGAKMAVFADGSTLGTVGGGAVEYESVRLAKKALAERTAFTHGFNLSHNQTADIGMICGGQVVVYFQFFGVRRAGNRVFRSRAEQFAERKEYLADHADFGRRRQADGHLFPQEGPAVPECGN